MNLFSCFWSCAWPGAKFIQRVGEKSISLADTTDTIRCLRSAINSFTSTRTERKMSKTPMLRLSAEFPSHWTFRCWDDGIFALSLNTTLRAKSADDPSNSPTNSPPPWELARDPRSTSAEWSTRRESTCWSLKDSSVLPRSGRCGTCFSSSSSSLKPLHRFFFALNQIRENFIE